MFSSASIGNSRVVDPNPLHYEKETGDNQREKKMLKELEQEIECPFSFH
jgi:hypothetical protein